MQHPTSSMLERSAVHLLHRMSQHASDTFARSVGDRYDLTARQLAVLSAIAESEGVTQTEICRKTGIDRSTLADIIKRMLRKGLLERSRAANDARAYAVGLSQNGRTVLATVAPLTAAVDDAIFAPLPLEIRQQFLTALALIVKDGNP